MKSKGVCLIILHIAIQIVTNLTQNVTAFFPQEPGEPGNSGTKTQNYYF